MLTLGLVLGAVLGAVAWDNVKQAEWFPWESENVKSLRLERDGYKQRLDDVVASLDVEPQMLAVLEARKWNVEWCHERESYASMYFTTWDPKTPRGWRVNGHFHTTLRGAFRKAIIAHDADVRLREEMAKVE